MDNDKIDLISKDLEFVKETVQDTKHRISNLESSMADFHKDFNEHIATDRHMSGEIAQIRKTLEKNTDSLVEHMRRTELNEMGINELKAISIKLDSRLTPVEKFQTSEQAVIKVGIKLCAFIGGIIGIASLLYDIFK